MVLAVSVGPFGVARAFDATLFYAPPADPVAHVPLVTPPQSAKRPAPPRGRVCFNHEEARDRIAALRLTEPNQVLRSDRLEGEALRAKLCRWKPDEFVYEIAVLRPDGHIVHVYMNAQNGRDITP